MMCFKNLSFAWQNQWARVVRVNIVIVLLHVNDSGVEDSRERSLLSLTHCLQQYMSHHSRGCGISDYQSTIPVHVWSNFRVYPTTLHIFNRDSE